VLRRISGVLLLTGALYAADAPVVTFLRDVAPILNKVGCTSGPCHGAAKGKNGFKLSLRGYDPAYDHEALTDELAGRRFNRVVPEQSLFLLKPTASVPHEGGKRIEVGSKDYELLKSWVEHGTPPPPSTQLRISNGNKLDRADWRLVINCYLSETREQAWEECHVTAGRHVVVRCDGALNAAIAWHSILAQSKSLCGEARQISIGHHGVHRSLSDQCADPACKPN
jgi:hypothetical protein